MVGAAPLRIVFFGTPEFAVPTLDALLASSQEVVAVITQPDRPRGRGHRMTDGPVKTRAIAAGIPVLQPASLKSPEFLQALTSLETDLGVVAAYGKILSETVLGVPRFGMLNVHASLLPAYRGAAPIHRAVAAGALETGVTIMRVVKALDAGAMLAKVRRPIGEDETSAEVERDLAHLGASLLVATVNRLAAGPVAEEPQDESQSTYAHRLTKEDGLVDWSRAARDVHNLIRGMHPWPNAYSYLAGQRLILLRSAVDDSEHGASPGTVLAARGEELRVAAGRGSVIIRELQAEGKRAATARDFLAGHRIAPGDRFASAP